MKLLIRGAGFENKGAEAMMRVVQRELGRRIPEANFYATVAPMETSFANKSGIIPLNCFLDTRPKLLRSLPFFHKIPELLLSMKNLHFARASKTHLISAYEINSIGPVDAVIDVSGFAYSDSCSWGGNAVKATWAWVEYCQLQQKPYILLSQAMGPFERKDIASWSKKIFHSAALVISRDNVSSTHLAKLQGISISEVRNAPDIAFCFRGAPSIVGNTILNNLGFERGKHPLIAIVPNMRVYERTPGTGAANLYVKLLIDLADYCIESFGANVLLAPNHIKVPVEAGADDRFLCSLIELHIQKPDQCFTIQEYYPSETVKSILGHVDLLIASRFHSLVFSLSQGIPVLALGWSHKYHELLRPFGLEEFVVDHVNLDTETVFSLVEKAWDHRKINNQHIMDTVPKLQANVNAIFDEVADMITGADR